HLPPQETSIEISHDQENVINSVQTFLTKFNRYSFFETPKVLLLAWDRVSEIKDAFDNKQYKLEDVQELFRKLLDDLQNIHEELAEFINSLSWNRPAVYDDDDDNVDYTIAITPVLSTEEPDNSLSMGDEHLDTILATKSDEVIKSSVKNLVLIPSELKGIPDTLCDVHLVNNPTPLEAKYQFEIVINSNNDYSSSDDDSLYYENIDESEGIPEHMCDVPINDNSPPLDVSKDQFEDFSESNDEFSLIDDDSFSFDKIDYVEALPPDSELVSSEVMEIVIPEVGGIETSNDNPILFYDPIISGTPSNLTPSGESDFFLEVDAFLVVEDETISSQFPKSYLDPEGDILLLEAFLNDDHSSDFKTNSSSTSLNSLLEETNNFDNSLPKFITFSNVLFDAEYESDSKAFLNDDHSSDFKTTSSSTSLNSLLEETNNFDNSLPEFTTFSK
nr:hypothetical protein [Tanacetum cinerariifolium]